MAREDDLAMMAVFYCNGWELYMGSAIPDKGRTLC